MSCTQSLATSTEDLFPETQNLVFHEAQARTEEGVQDSYSSVWCAMNITESPLLVLWTAQGSCGEVCLSRNLLLLMESLSESVGRLKLLSRHQPTFGLGRANESHLHSSLAKKKPCKILLSCTQEFLRKIYFHGNLQFFTLKRNFTISLNQKRCHFYHWTSHFFPSVQNLSRDTWAWKNLQEELGRTWMARSRALTQFLLWL